MAVFVLTLAELEQSMERKGWLIANVRSQIKKVSGTCYDVRSRSGDGSYVVSLTGSGWVCERLTSMRKTGMWEPGIRICKRCCKTVCNIRGVYDAPA